MTFEEIRARLEPLFKLIDPIVHGREPMAAGEERILPCPYCTRGELRAMHVGPTGLDVKHVEPACIPWVEVDSAVRPPPARPAN